MTPRLRRAVDYFGIDHACLLSVSNRAFRRAVVEAYGRGNNNELDILRGLREEMPITWEA